jgi:hypothetical protein
MDEYFHSLNEIDPLFHALVRAKLREMSEELRQECTVNDLTDQEELDILRAYCITLHKEYRSLRTLLIENMQVTPRSVGLKHTSN